MSETTATSWSEREFETRLRALGRRYHIHHPYHLMMNEGKLEKRQIQGWVLNRFYYQISLPLKDAALISNCPDREIRRLWVRRIIDHDGKEGEQGGIEAWIHLAEACGIARQELLSLQHVLPGVRFAVDAYVNFVRQSEWQEAVCSSLTELFAPTIHRVRLENWPKHYPWIEAGGLEYFRRRIGQAHRDVEHGLSVTLRHFRTPKQQAHALEILQFKLDVLWSMLDAMYMAYVENMGPYANINGA